MSGGQNLPKSIFYHGKCLILHNFWFTLGSKTYKVVFEFLYRYCNLSCRRAKIMKMNKRVLSGSANSDFFLVQEMWLTRKKVG